MRKQTIDLSKRLEAQECNCAIRLASQVSGYPEFVLDFEKHIFDFTTHATDCTYRIKAASSSGSRTQLFHS